MTNNVSSIKSPIYRFRLKDFHSAISHFIGFVASIILTPILLIKAAAMGATTIELIWYSIFMMSLVLLYGASSAYHSFDISKTANDVLKRLDHAMIFVLIAGSYTPICMVGMKTPAARNLCITVWGIAIVGTIIKMFWIYCPKWFSSVLYLSMGWACIFQVRSIYQCLPTSGFALLLAGGIIYTIGGLIYPINIKNLTKNAEKEFGMHEIFHIFILGGSLCHYLMIFFVITAM